MIERLKEAFARFDAWMKAKLEGEGFFPRLGRLCWGATWGVASFVVSVPFRVWDGAKLLVKNPAEFSSRLYYQVKRALGVMSRVMFLDRFRSFAEKLLVGFIEIYIGLIWLVMLPLMPMWAAIGFSAAIVAGVYASSEHRVRVFLSLYTYEVFLAEREVLTERERAEVSYDYRNYLQGQDPERPPMVPARAPAVTPVTVRPAPALPGSTVDEKIEGLVRKAEKELAAQTEEIQKEQGPSLPASMRKLEL